MAKRKIFDELMEGIEAMKGHRDGKITLRTYKVEAAPLPKVDSKLIRDTRKRLRCSRAVFARRLRINERTLEKWEQGRARPNPQAAALVLLVRNFPDTLDRLERVAMGWWTAPSRKPKPQAKKSTKPKKMQTGGCMPWFLQIMGWGIITVPTRALI